MGNGAAINISSSLQRGVVLRGASGLAEIHEAREGNCEATNISSSSRRSVVLRGDGHLAETREGDCEVANICPSPRGGVLLRGASLLAENREGDSSPWRGSVQQVPGLQVRGASRLNEPRLRAPQSHWTDEAANSSSRPRRGVLMRGASGQAETHANDRDAANSSANVRQGIPQQNAQCGPQQELTSHAHGSNGHGSTEWPSSHEVEDSAEVQLPSLPQRRGLAPSLFFGPPTAGGWPVPRDFASRRKCLHGDIYLPALPLKVASQPSPKGTLEFAREERRRRAAWQPSHPSSSRPKLPQLPELCGPEQAPKPRMPFGCLETWRKGWSEAPVRVY